MNILISVNSEYIDKAQTMLYSVYMHTKERVDIYILNSSLTDSEIQSFSEYLMAKCSMVVHEITIDDNIFDGFPIGPLSKEAYYRVVAQYYLPQDLERILWLDADIIVMNDITSFYNMPFNGKKMIVCPDRCNNSDYVNKIKKKLGLSDDYVYFNSGVLLINLELLRAEKDQKELLYECRTIIDRIEYHDQDLLNYLYSDSVGYEDWKVYNYQLLGINKISKEELNRIAILHYAGREKPWEYSHINSVSKYYWKVKSLQGYKKESRGMYKTKVVGSFLKTINSFKDIFLYLRDLLYVSKKA